jgi:hypothetical protein
MVIIPFKVTSLSVMLKCDHPVSVTGIVLEGFGDASEDRGSLFQRVTVFCVERSEQTSVIKNRDRRNGG